MVHLAHLRSQEIFPANIRHSDDVFKDVLKTSSGKQFFAFQDVLKKTWRRLQDVLEDKKLLRFIMTKNTTVLWSHSILFIFYIIVTPKAPHIFVWRYRMSALKRRENLGNLLWLASELNYDKNVIIIIQDSSLLFVFKIIVITISFILIRKRFS